ncbi:zf-HC2 domain-containing protein [Paenibacillus sp. N1-5-1-14]|uniref:anti-sigma factor family protein n=1 Tax=Paenibacillus radicibacter TaxID=2972488 RepID=UPI0021596D56|nr:zf-HC2 domain-containing protein [Paenibacillus radicibacter]MCR8642269.1 zf-HC2 domain-containing protein [Paenibacillus radicibacter]
MRCNEVREQLGDYWDMPEDAPQRIAIDQHVLTCAECAEEFQIWQESTQLIRSAMDESAQQLSSYSSHREENSISSKVMKRIYEDDSWRLPVPERMYAFSRKMRRNLLVAISFCLILSLGSILFTMIYDMGSRSAVDDSSIYSIQAPQALDAQGGYKGISKKTMTTAVANVSSSFVEPVRFQVGPIDSYPDYLLVLSLLGFISMILIMNWFTRMKS